MASKITVQVLGGEAKVIDNVETIADVKRKLGVTNHSASINGEAADDNDEVSDYSYVTLSPSVKGGR
jgi:hypothetical protein